MLILAHRGLWRERDERNSVEALGAALGLGFGIETDLRDHDGELVIAHDPPSGQGHLTFRALLDCYIGLVAAAPLALNIKADGLHMMVADALAERPGLDAFVFDMSVPDSIGYRRNGIPTFTRHSELEPHPAYYDAADGVWVDCFESDWIDSSVINAHLDAGKRVALVSPELHGRDPAGAWACWADMDHGQVMLCTDFPEKAATFFNGGIAA